MLCAAVLTACSVSGPSSAPSTGSLLTNPERSADPLIAAPRRPAKIALLLPLSAPGQTAVIAKAMKQAGELALFEHDGAGVQLMVKDDKGTPEGARAAAEDAVRNGAELLLGPLLSKSVAAAAPVARAAGLSVVAFSNDRQVAGNGVYLLSFLPKPEIDRIVDHVASAGNRRFAALIPDDTFGKLAAESFSEAVARNGGTVVAQQTYPAKALTMLEPLHRLREVIRTAEDQGAPIEAIFLPGGQETLATLAPLLAQAEIDPKRLMVLGTGGLDYPNAGRDAALLGARYPGPDPAGWRDFTQRYVKSYGHAPPRIATLAYDAVAIACTLAKGPDGARFAPTMLMRPTGFTGVDGLVRLMPDGTVERALAILEVQKFGAGIVEAAPVAISEPSAPAPVRQRTGSIFN